MTVKLIGMLIHSTHNDFRTKTNVSYHKLYIYTQRDKFTQPKSIPGRSNVVQVHAIGA